MSAAAISIALHVSQGPFGRAVPTRLRRGHDLRSGTCPGEQAGRGVAVATLAGRDRAVYVQPECAEPLLCDCFEEADCTGTCVSRRWAGERCDEANTLCARGTECLDGICVGVASQALFEQACE